MQRCAKAQVGKPAELGIQIALIRHDADEMLRRPRPAGAVYAAYMDHSGIGLRKTCEQVYRRGYAGAVRA